MMSTNKKFNLISGLPRSGTTLLTSILNQNPRFTSGISDPLFDIAKSYMTARDTHVGMKSIISDDRLKDLILDMFNSFYKDGNEVCFNTNRSWTSEVPFIKSIFPNYKMIVCVRHIPWILDSFEVLERKNPLELKPLYDYKNLSNVYQRSHALMGALPDVAGRVAGPLESLKHLAYSEDRYDVMFIDYDALVQHPREVMKLVYNYIEEEWFEHDFDNVGTKFEKYDMEAKIKDLHTVRDKVGYNKRTTILPKDLWDHYASSSFWLTDQDIFSDVKYVNVMNREADPIQNIETPNKKIEYKTPTNVAKNSNAAGYIPSVYK